MTEWESIWDCHANADRQLTVRRALPTKDRAATLIWDLRHYSRETLPEVHIIVLRISTRFPF